MSTWLFILWLEELLFNYTHTSGVTFCVTDDVAIIAFPDTFLLRRTAVRLFCCAGILFFIHFGHQTGTITVSEMTFSC